jgi:predicted nuclease of predicted toxin-antitoxin system
MADSSFIALYTDEDVTTALAPALRERGYESQSTSEAKMREQSDETQLEYATRNNMAILTANRRDFLYLARRRATLDREHGGIIVTEQFRREQFDDFLQFVLKFLETCSPDEIRNRIVYLSQFHD